MPGALTVAVEVVLSIGLLVLVPCWIVCFFQLVKWLHIAERQLKPGAYVADSRPLLLAFFGRTAVLFQPDMLTEKGLDARKATIKWFRRMVLVLAVSAALLWMNQLVHPKGDWLAADDRSPSIALAGARQVAAT